MKRSDKLISAILLGAGVALAAASIPAEPISDQRTSKANDPDSVVAPAEAPRFDLTEVEIRELGTFSARGPWQLEQQPLETASKSTNFQLAAGLAAGQTGSSCFCGASDAIFSDGFESGNTSAWSQTTP